MATKQRKINYEKMLKLVQEMERDYKAIRNVPENDKRLIKCHKLMLPTESSSEVPIKVNVRPIEVYARGSKLARMYQWFIHENGTIQEAYSRFDVNKKVSQNFFNRKCNVSSRFTARYKDKLYSEKARYTLVQTLRANGCRYNLKKMIEISGLHKVYTVNKVIFGDNNDY